MIKIIIFLGSLLSFSTIGYAQLIDQFAISIYSEAIGLPFTNYSPIHPGIEIAGTLHKNEKANSIRYLNAKVGFFHHQRLENAWYIGGEYQYSRKLFKEKLSVDLPVGLGYLHSFYPGDLYEQNQDGDFEAISQLGRAHLYLNLGIGLTYLSESKIQPFIRQELLLEAPFANGIPAIPHSLLKIGVQINL